MISEAWTNGPAGVRASTPLKARRRARRAPVPPARVRVGVRDPPLCPGASGGRDCSGGLCPAGGGAGGHRGTAGGVRACVPACARAPGPAPTRAQPAVDSPRTSERGGPGARHLPRRFARSPRPARGAAGAAGVVCAFDMNFSETRCQCLN